MLALVSRDRPPADGASVPPPTPALRDASSADGLPAADLPVLVVVEPDPFLRELIEAAFRLAQPDLVVRSAAHPAAARPFLAQGPVAAVVTELELDGSLNEGLRFVRALAADPRSRPAIVLLTALPSDRLPGGLVADAVIGKPPDIDLLLRQVDRLVPARSESLVRGIALESFLQVLQIDRKTVAITVSAGSRVGRLYLQTGELVHADAEGRRGRDAFFVMMSWPDVLIRLSRRPAPEVSIDDRLTGLLLEWGVRRDHGLA